MNKFLSEESAPQFERPARIGARLFSREPQIIRKLFGSANAKRFRRKKPAFEVLLFWKDDTRSEQREISVEAVKKNDVWLIDNVADGQ